MAGQFRSVESAIWGHQMPPVNPAAIAEKLEYEVIDALSEFRVLLEDPEPCRDRAEYSRVWVKIPLSSELFDQLLNGNSGYRAQYFLGMDNGEHFNRMLVDCVAPLIVRAERFYTDKFDREFCERSLCGQFTKFWYSKDITDPSGQEYLSGLPEVIRVNRWVRYWSQRDKPWKGLLAPKPENTDILLNGTFVHPDTGDVYEQKPERSRHLYECGWT